MLNMRIGIVISCTLLVLACGRSRTGQPGERADAFRAGDTVSSGDGEADSVWDTAEEIHPDMPSPEAFLGKKVGADRFLAPFPKIIEYFEKLDSASDRISMEIAGKATSGRDIPLLVLTSEENQKKLPRLRDIARQLANPDRSPPEKLERLVREGRAVVLVSCTIHSTEVGCTQMSMEFAYRFATTRDPNRLSWMKNVVLLLLPSANPDGQHLVVDWYNKHLGTPFEGGRMPWLYHPYTGHDLNRDFYMLTQKESQTINRILYHRWYPQVYMDQHQMGSTGPRMFVPPQTDPIAPEFHSLVFRQADLLGTHMSLRLEEAGKLGVGHALYFDSYWPGATRNTAWWKNVTGLLTEMASVRIATPIYIEPGELKGGGKGLPEYNRRANFPSVWPGGWWRLRDIVDYELIATWSLLEACSQHRTNLLKNFVRMGRESVKKGNETAPYAWLVPPEQHDPVAAIKMIGLLREHGIRILQTDRQLQVGDRIFTTNTPVIPAAQPYRAFLKTMLEHQRYPERLAYPDGPIIKPYDVTAWDLPTLMGVEIVRLDKPLPSTLVPYNPPAGIAQKIQSVPGGYLINHRADTAHQAVNRLLGKNLDLYRLHNAVSDTAKGQLYLPPGQLPPPQLAEILNGLHLPVQALTQKPTGTANKIHPVRIGLFKPWYASKDEGWTRFVLEQAEFPMVSLSNQDLRKKGFGKKLDVLLLPDVDAAIIRFGRPDTKKEKRYRPFAPLPPPYAGGIDEKTDGKAKKLGSKHIKDWIENGGTAVALDSSCQYLIDLLELPVKNVLDEIPRERFLAPGTMLNLRVDTEHALGFGMRQTEVAYFVNSPAFETYLPDARIERRVVASYPEHEQDLLVAGYLHGGRLLRKKAAVVEFKLGRGRVVLIGFRAQHRAQPHRTFKLLFNALRLAGLKPTSL